MMNERFADGAEFIPGKSHDFSDAVEASGRTRSIPNLPASSAPAKTPGSPAVPESWSSPNSDANGVTPSGGVELADIGQADQAPKNGGKSIASDTGTLRRSILATLAVEAMHATEAERVYGENLMKCDPCRSSFREIERLQRAIGESGSLDEIRAHLAEIALLTQCGPFSNAAIDRLLRRQWMSEVLPKAKILADGFHTKLDEFEESLAVEKRLLNERFGFLGFDKMLGADKILAELRAELAHFREVLRQIGNGGPLQGNPPRNLIREFSNR